MYVFTSSINHVQHTRDSSPLAWYWRACNNRAQQWGVQCINHRQVCSCDKLRDTNKLRVKQAVEYERNKNNEEIHQYGHVHPMGVSYGPVYVVIVNFLSQWFY